MKQSDESQFKALSLRFAMSLIILKSHTPVTQYRQVLMLGLSTSTISSLVHCVCSKVFGSSEKYTTIVVCKGKMSHYRRPYIVVEYDQRIIQIWYYIHVYLL